MRLKNIALSIGLLIAMLSCSMSEEIAMNAGEGGKDTYKDVYAAVLVDISAKENLGTKAGSTTGPEADSDYSKMNSEEMAVNECFAFVANGDEIIGSRHYSKSDIISLGNGKYGINEQKHILVKVKKGQEPDLTVFVVGMNSDEGQYFETNIFSKATSLKALKQRVIGGDGVGNPITDFIKVGENTIKPYSQDTENGYQTSDKTKAFECNDGNIKCGKAEIELGLRAAAIELMSFKVVTATGKVVADLITTRDEKDNNGNLKSITTNNGGDISASGVRAIVKDIIMDSRVENSVLHPTDGLLELPENNKVYTTTSFLDEAGSNNDLHPLDYRFYTYQNSNVGESKKTKVTIRYEVEGIPGECSFYIKTGDTNEVLAGHLYQLHVTIKNAVATIQITTKDWLHNKIEQGMQEVKYE
ncbi:hypothetical protein [Parabacteroides sp. AM08-6]|uniref:hypothetical protein n=1 Tax=Parabacteroides sp. AM08-6 TaxID=2292053 RepID=UPI0011C3956B|nr:hypothetical protein [Parabacteroides sp. AM08-6]